MWQKTLAVMVSPELPAELKLQNVHRLLKRAVPVSDHMFIWSRLCHERKYSQDLCFFPSLICLGRNTKTTSLQILCLLSFHLKCIFGVFPII